MRLSSGSLPLLPAGVGRFAYDREAQAVGLVHLGIGAFHRAHQACYTDRAMDAGDRDWAIAGVSLRSGDVAAQMNPQDGLFTLTERSGAGAHIRVVGAVRAVLVAPVQRPEAVALMARASTRIVSLSITEKGYCRAADGSIDHQQADAASAYALLAAALRLRHDAGAGGLTLLSCDNLARNGRQMARLMGEYLHRHDRALLPWFEAECACPSTMVDRIVPATTDDDRAEIARALGMEDRAAVVSEPFSQWVIEDRFAAGRPAWEQVGAELVGDVGPYETAKLRMLNGAHSLLAYCGLLRGHRFVHQAIADRELRPLVDQLMLAEALPTIDAAPGQDLRAYAAALVARFANPALNHRLEQIAMDGSQKIPQRWLETLARNRAAGRDCPAILAGLAAWARHVRGDNGTVHDPRAEELAAAWRAGDARTALQALFASGGLFDALWVADDAGIDRLQALLAAPA